LDEDGIVNANEAIDRLILSLRHELEKMNRIIEELEKLRGPDDVCDLDAEALGKITNE
jgi:hypothetical protein